MAARLSTLSPLPATSQVLAAPTAFLLAALALVGTSLVGIVHPLQNLNEGLYARIPAEMLANRDLVIPTLNGVPYLEKPPLLYWVTALAYALFGVSEAAARAAPVLGALLTFTAVAWYARCRLARHAGAYALAILVSAPIVVVMGRTVMFDMLLTGCLAWALVTLDEGLRRAADPRLLRASAVMLALAVLTKGLAPLAFHGAIALILVPSRDAGETRRRLRALCAPGAVALFVLVAAPWHLAAAWREPGFAHFYFVNEHALRFLDRRVPHDYHTGPWWYYLPRLPAYLFPWTLLFAAPFAWRSAAAGPRRFLLAWFLVPLVLFSLSKAKAPYYLLICAPPLALLLGNALAHQTRLRAPLAVVAVAWLAILGIAAALDDTRFLPYVLPPARVPIVAAAAGLAAAAFVSALRREPLVSAGLLAMLALPVAFLFSQVLQVNEPLRSARALAAEIAHSGRPAYLFRDFEAVSALPFYLGHDVGVVAPDSADLWYGRQLRPQSGVYPSATEFERRADTAAVWLVVDDRRRAEFEASPLARHLVPWARVGSLALYASPLLIAELRGAPRATIDEHAAGTAMR